jgi:hypothetical protein
MIDLLKSIFFPGPFDYDFRPVLIVLIIMISSITYAIRNNWHGIKDDFHSDWE